MQEVPRLRAEVVDSLVRDLATGGVRAVTAHVEHELRGAISDGEVPSGVTNAEYIEAVRRVKAMTPAELLAAAQPDPPTGQQK